MKENTYILTETQMQDIIGVLFLCESALKRCNNSDMAGACWNTIKWIDDIKPEEKEPE